MKWLDRFVWTMVAYAPVHVVFQVWAYITYPTNFFYVVASVVMLGMAGLTARYQWRVQKVRARDEPDEG